MSSLPEESRPVTGEGSSSAWSEGVDDPEGEGGHSSAIEPPIADEVSRADNNGKYGPSLNAQGVASNKPAFLPSSLPRHSSNPSLGRAATSSSARNSSDSPRRPPFVDRVTSSRSLFIPSVVYSGSQDPDEDTAGPARNDWRATAVGATPLDRTMDRIGMGRYQWTVLILSGLGWAADNMWIQAIAIILPHIQRFFTLTDGIVGLASSSIFVGMFVGSIAWGAVSDSYGRRAAFNITLAVTAIFGCLAAVAGSFPLLCLLLFAVGTGVGGSMPTDSSNLVENLPVRKHSYVTALSVFFSAGSVISSLIGLSVLSASNPEGWRWLLGALAFVTVLFVTARVVFFRLLESPKYLVHAGRPQEAREILQKISQYNGNARMSLRIQDVVDDHSHANPPNSGGDLESSQHSLHQRPSSQPPASRIQSVYEADEDDDAAEDPTRDPSSRPLLGPSDDADDGSRRSGEQDNSVLEHSASAISTRSQANAATTPKLPSSLSWLPASWHPSVADLASRYSEMFSPEWKRTTILIWIIWGGMSYGFTTFNVLLPKLLEQRYDAPRSSSSSAFAEQPDDASIRRAMLDILVYSLSSLPGSLISAYMVETRLGRIGTMVSSTTVMAASVLVFSVTFWRSSLTMVSVSSSIAYAAIYGYTPEVMGPTIRATACGTASAISRVAGIIAPLLAGWAYSLAPPIPLFMATSVLGLVAVSMAVLPIETRGRATDANHSGNESTITQ